MTRPISSTRLIRSYNVSTVLRTLHQRGNCSRSQLTELTGLSPATITRIIADLLNQGLVLEGQAGQSTGGRRPVFLHIDYTKLYIVSVKISKDGCIIAILDLRGQTLARDNLDPSSLEPEVLIAEIVTGINALLAKYKVNKEHVLGVGVAISGVVNQEEGYLINSVNLGWQNIPVAELFGDALDLPVYVENDANASVLAEFWFGNAKNTMNSMYIKTETGAGIGIIIGKTLLSGPRSMIGEIGHVPLIQNGKPCRCGQKGCLETYVYLGDVLQRYQDSAGHSVSRTEFISLVQNEDDSVLGIVDETAQALALACASWGVLLDLDVITIGGFWGEFQKEIVHYCQNYYSEVLEKTGIPREITISQASFGEDTDLLGAAGLVIDRWFVPYPVPLDR